MTKTSSLYPILGHPNFTPGLQHTEYANLRELGWEQASRFVTSGRWVLLAELTDMLGTYCLPFWKAARLHHFLLSILDPHTFFHPQTTFEAYCSEFEPLSQTLSKMYALLNSPSEQPRLLCLEIWEADLDRTFTEKQKTQHHLCHQILHVHQNPGNKL